MKIISNDIHTFNMMRVNEKKYFIINNDNIIHFIPATCPHRGGPLQFGHFDTGDISKIVCPWHENKYRICNLEKKSFPSISVLGRVNVIVDSEDQVDFWREVLPLEM